MIQVRRAEERGVTKIDWLDSRHTFSFGEYHDPAAMGFRGLRVINDDRVAPGGGFATHGHRDMEIFTWVLDGALEHKDSLGTGSVIQPGDAQRMSAGTGIHHSEFNHSRTEAVRLLQIWILPERNGLTPGYEQKQFPVDQRRNRWRLIAAPDGRDGAITIHRNVDVYSTVLSAGTSLSFPLRPGRHAWLQVARGTVGTSAGDLSEGAGLACSEEKEITVSARDEAELLLFDLD